MVSYLNGLSKYYSYFFAAAQKSTAIDPEGTGGTFHNFLLFNM